MKLRMLAASTAVAVLTAFGGGIGVAAMDTPSATAAPAPSPLAKQVNCKVQGVPTTCIVRVTSIQVVNGAMQASGTVTSRGHYVTAPFSGVPLADPPGCPLLSLTLGPLHLNLLGLVLNLNQVILNLTALPGAGNLLGNLLCAVANLLDGSNPAALTAVLDAINAILAGL